MRHTSGAVNNIECDWVEAKEDKGGSIMLLVRTEYQFSIIRNVEFYQIIGENSENTTNE
jgi:hypothetical protein